MKSIDTGLGIIQVTPDNLVEAGLFCIRNRKSEGYRTKEQWFAEQCHEGLTLKIVNDVQGNQLGFIEYLPAEQAWRPVKARWYMFIHCIMVPAREARRAGVGAALLNQCEQDARERGMNGVCVMCSDGPWMANGALFQRNGYIVADRIERFELLAKTFDKTVQTPVLRDWRKERAGYIGWNLIYADQCPWHAKSVHDITQAAHEHGIPLAVRKLLTPNEAQRSPSGFGTFSLIRDGRLLADHFISRTRFENILRAEHRLRD